MRGDGTYDRHIGRMIQTIARWRGIPMTRLAKDLGFAYSSLMDRIHGRRRFTAEEIRDVACYLEVSTDKILVSEAPEFACLPSFPALGQLRVAA
jgi:hypothetical protein